MNLSRLSPIRLGIDFDNTIVDYDDLFRETAKAFAHEFRSKEELRYHVRTLPDGETTWQQIQAEVYGERVSEAKSVEGFDAFVRRCDALSVPIFVVSHKTNFAAQNSDVNLRKAALEWMESQGFFDDPEAGLARSRVFFEDSRKSKISRIQDLRCTHFIDDLREVFLEEKFPEGIVKILLSKHRQEELNGILTLGSWQEISGFLLGRELSGIVRAN